MEAGRHKGIAEQMRAVAEEAITLARMLVTVTGIRSAPGVYFLLRRGAVVYVGKSDNVLFRMAGHKPKEFDDVRMLHVAAPAERDRLERAYIHLLVPRLNIQQQRFNDTAAMLNHPEIGRSGVSAKTALQRGPADANSENDAEIIGLQAAPVLNGRRDS